MSCPTTIYNSQFCDSILNFAEELIRDEGILSFRYTKISKQNICAPGTFYKYFKNKEDLLLCLFMRNSATNYILKYIDSHTEMTQKERVLLPLIVILTLLKRDKSFKTLRFISINSQIWRLASDEKVKKFRTLGDIPYKYIYESLIAAAGDEKLNAELSDMKMITQMLYFYVCGYIPNSESSLIKKDLLPQNINTIYKSLEIILNTLNWSVPFTHFDFQNLEQKLTSFLLATPCEITCNRCQQIYTELSKNLIK